MRRFLIFLLLIFLTLLAAACSASAPEAVVETVEVEKEVVVTPVAEAPAEEKSPTPQPAELQPTAAPAVAETPPEKPTSIPALPTVVEEKRVVELEYPPSMRLGDSDVVRLSLVPSEDGYTVQTDYPEHQTDTQDIIVVQKSGYELSGIARLDAVGFEVSPQAEQERFIPQGQQVNWQWALTPRAPGQQRLVVTLWLRWKPVENPSAPMRETEIYSRSSEYSGELILWHEPPAGDVGGLFGLDFWGRSEPVCAGGFGDFPACQDPGGKPESIPGHRNAPGSFPTPAETSLLRSLFNRYSRLVLESEFLSGIPGRARSWLCRSDPMGGQMRIRLSKWASGKRSGMRWKTSSALSKILCLP